MHLDLVPFVLSNTELHFLSVSFSGGGGGGGMLKLQLRLLDRINHCQVNSIILFEVVV